MQHLKKPLLRQQTQHNRELESMQTQEMGVIMKKWHQPSLYLTMHQIIHCDMSQQHSFLYAMPFSCPIDCPIVILQSSLHNKIYNLSHLKLK